LPEGVGKDSVEFGTELTSIAGGALGITKGAMQLAEHITPELTVLSKVGGAFAIAGGAIGLYHDIQSYKDGVNATDVISTVSDTAKIVGGVMMFTPLAPVGGIILGASAVVDAGVWLYNNQDKVAHVADAVGREVSQAATEVAHVANEVSHVAESIVSTVASNVTSSVTNTFHALGGFFK